MKRIKESARWADLTIRLVVKANNMSVRMKYVDQTIRIKTVKRRWSINMIKDILP